MWHIFAKRYIAFYFPVAGPENRETHTDDRCSRKKSRPTYSLEPFVVGMKSIAKIEACKIKMMIVFLKLDFVPSTIRIPGYVPLPRRYIIGGAPHFDTGAWRDSNA